MNLDSLSFSLIHIGNLVTNLNKKNFKSSIQEITQLIEVLGVEAQTHLLSCLFSHVDLEAGKSSLKENPHLQCLQQQCAALVTRPSFVRVVCYVVDHPAFKRKYRVPQFLGSLSRTLKLNRAEEVAFGIALLHSRDPECRQHAELFVQHKLPDLIKSYIDSADATGAVDEGGLHESSPELLHQLVSWLLYAPPEQLDKAADSQEGFLEAIRKDFPRELVPVVLAPLIYPESSDLPPDKIHTPATMANNLLDGSLSDFVLETGYALCSSVDECRRQLAGHGVAELTAASVARVLGAMLRTYSGGLTDQIPIQSLQNVASIWGADSGGSAAAGKEGAQTWNVEVFVRAVHELVPSLQWNEVVYHLDHPGFQVPDRTALRLLTQALQLGLQLQAGRTDQFPVETLYRVWKNADSQLSYINQTLKNSDVFCLADYHCHMVDVAQLKVVPDKDNKDISTWRCTELSQLLLHLADNGHSCAVQELLKFPVQNCPDILMLNLLASGSNSHLSQELLSNLFFVFLAGHHPNSSAVLHQAWHTTQNAPSVHGMIIHAMAEWYRQAESDQTRLSRILDVAQDLKALSLLLNYQAFAFVIDLACLASRREYLKLDKWISDKIHEHGEPFLTACVKFLQRRVPQLASGPGALKDLEPPPPSSAPLPAALVAGMLNVLHSRASTPSAGVSTELSEAILTMVGNAGQLMMGRTAGRPQGAPLGQQQGPPTAPPPPGVVRPSRGLESAFGPSPLSSQLFPSQSADLLVSGLSAGIGGLGLGGGGGSSATSGVSVANNGGSMAPSSGTALAMSGSYASMSGVTTLGGGVSVSRPGQQPHGLLGGPLASLSAGGPSAGLFPTAGAAGTSAGAQHALPARPSSQADMAIFQSETTVLSREVEEEANSNFQRIYNHPPHPTLSIEEVLDMLKRFQDSSVSREREVFACMLRSLMDEYKFFPQYPDKELYITAQLFGGIIEHNLVTNYMGLGIALRYVLDAIKKPPGSKMYNFGIVALDRFKHRLREYPQYCQHLAAVEHFTQFPRHLVDYVECGIRSQEPLSRPEGPVLPPHLLAAVGDSGAATGTGSGAATVAHVPPPPPSAAITAVVQQPPPASSQLVAPPAAAAAAAGSSVSRGPLPAGRPSIANTTNIETLVNALTEVIAPSDVVQDKIGFIFNNLSQINLPQKREDLLEVLEKDYYRWFAQYIVMRRVSIEPNFHTLYANFLDALKLPELMGMVVRELHRNIQVLMRADKGVEKFNDRTILKNLGHWLGLMTIAKNKPVLQIEIDVKALIVEAYHLGVHEMLYIVPFVAKIIESCAKSKIFKPPNPWTMGIMSLLAELHQEEDLKLNLKFEIEVLCKTLSLDVNELKPTNWLNDHMRLQTLPIQLKRPSPPAMALSVMPPPPPPPAPAGFQTPTSGLMSSASAAYQHKAVATAGGVYHSASALEEHMMSSSSQAPLAMPPTLAPPPPLSMPADGGQRPPVPPPAPPHPPPVASEPRFSFSDINTSSIAGLASHTTINNALPLFQSNPQLKHIVRPAVERTVQDWLPRSVERYCKLAVSTVEQIVKKDFALDPDEVKMRTAAHQMVMNLTAGLTLINCRDPLHLSISNNVKSALMATARAASQQHKDFIDQTAGLVAADNVELACCFIQKSVVERAIAEVDKRLATDYEARKLARVEGRRYVDPVVAGYQEARMPESIRLRPISQQQMAVYEEFMRVIPGFAGGAGSASTAVTSADNSQFLPGLPGTMTAPPLPMRATQPPPLRAAGLPTAAAVAPQQLQQAAAGGDDMSVILDKLALELQSAVQSLHPAAVGTTQGQQISRLAEDVAVARGTRDVASHVHLIKLAVDGLLEYMSQLPSDPELALRFRDAHLLILRALQDPRVYGPHWVQKQVTSFVVDWRDDARLNADAVDALLRARLISIPQLDAHLSHAMETGNYSVVGLAMQLLQAFLVDERSTLVSECDLINTIEALSKIAQQQGCPENIGHLLELVRGGSGGGGAPGSAVGTVASHEMALTADRTPGGPTAHIHKGISQARDFDDPPGMQEKTEYLLREWVSLYHSPGSGRDSTKAFTNIVHQMNLQGILKTDDLITRFFRLSTQLCVDLCYRALNDPASGSPTLIRDKCFRTLDAFVRLIALLVKHSGESPHAVSKINLLNKVLGIVTGVLLQDHEVRKTEFQQLSYHRIFIMLLLELNAPETVLEAINFQVLTAFCNVLHILRPEKAPGFAYAWLDILSHRVFIGRMLAVTPQHKGWGPYAQLLIDLFNFLSPFLRNAELAKPVTVLYKGCLRVLLVLLHDFPEFLCDYHYNFCDVIPPNCIQMRNLILSAFPRNMPPPDPFTSKLQVDMIPEIREAPMIQTNFASLIQPATFKNELDTYLSTRTPVTFVTDLRTTLQFNPEPGCHYSIKLMNALVLYVGTQAIGMIQSKGLQPTKQTIAHSAHMDIFQSLAVDLDTEGRYLFLNAIANQLRYPNSHTNYFLNLLLYLFAEANTSAIQEQITRVLLERLIVNRPHPWGLLITFIELIKNPSFKFWNHEFVHCAPEIEKLFDSVARSCVAQGQKVNALRAAAAASQQAAAAGAPGVPDQ